MTANERLQADRVPPRERILAAVLELLAEGDVDAVSTRSITSRAGVQAPAIYRLFGDMGGLLDAAAEAAYADWVARKKHRPPPPDPVAALRSGWDDAVQFGLDHPAVYRLVEGRTGGSPSTRLGRELLLAKVERAASAGLLRVDAPHAAALLHASGRGVVLTLLDLDEDHRPADLAALAREAVMAAIAVEPGDHADELATAAATVRRLLPADGTPGGALEGAERAVLDLWLRRIADA